jgi:hypothetical protein
LLFRHPAVTGGCAGMPHGDRDAGPDRGIGDDQPCRAAGCRFEPPIAGRAEIRAGRGCCAGNGRRPGRGSRLQGNPGCLLHWCGGVGVAMADSAGANRSEPDAGTVRAGGHRFHRSIGLLSASLAALAGWLYVYASATVTACLVHRLACRGGRRLSGLGPVPPQLAIRRKGDPRGVPRGSVGSSGLGAVTGHRG